MFTVITDRDVSILHLNSQSSNREDGGSIFLRNFGNRLKITRYHNSVQRTLKSHCCETSKSRSIEIFLESFFARFPPVFLLLCLYLLFYNSLLLPSFRVRSIFLYAETALRKRISTSLLSFSFDRLLTSNIDWFKVTGTAVTPCSNVNTYLGFRVHAVRR
jgi:hypothetical protein